jgi:hypothetical protein
VLVVAARSWPAAACTAVSGLPLCKAFDMDVALYEMINTAADSGITFILLAHHKENRQKGAPNLDDLSGIG